MALKTLHFVQGLSRTPLLFIPRYLTNMFFKNISQNKKISRIDNLKICNFKNPGSLTRAQLGAFRTRLDGAGDCVWQKGQVYKSVPTNLVFGCPQILIAFDLPLPPRHQETDLQIQCHDHELALA